MPRFNKFVADGWLRARKSLEPVVRAEVAAEYANRLSAATADERLELERQMQHEVECRVQEKAPRHGLY